MATRLRIEDTHYFIDATIRRSVLCQREGAAETEVFYESKEGAINELFYERDALVLVTDDGGILVSPDFTTNLKAGVAIQFLHCYDWFQEQSWCRKRYNRHFINSLLEVKIAALKEEDFTITERLNCQKYSCFELFRMKDAASLDVFFEEILRQKVSTEQGRAIYCHKSKKAMAQSIYWQYKVGSEKFVKKRLLQNLHDPVFLVFIHQIADVLVFLYNCFRQKVMHDIKMIVIPDLSIFFNENTTEEEANQTLRFLCEIPNYLGVKLIAGYCDETTKNEFILAALNSFNHNDLDRFVQLEEVKKLVFSEGENN